MSLQGSIETFAIADVLRLLAATSKSGRLHVQGPARAGTVWVDSARVLAAESPSTPHVGGAVDIIFQLLRFERGSFRFELDKYPPNPGDPLDIELALGEAESMLREWRELEQQIPAGDSWVQLRTAIDTPSVTLSAEEWITLVAVSGGRTVADIGDALESGELQTARAIARLLDLGLVEVGPRPAAASSTPMLVAAVTEAEAVPAPPESTVIDVPAPPAAPEAKAPAAEAPEAKAPEAKAPEAKAPEAPTSNGATSLVPPAPPAPPAPPVAPAWTPSDAAPGWAAPAEFPTLAPPPAAAPAPPSVDLTRADAGLVAPRAGDTFPTPPETDLDANGATSFSYPAAEAPSDVFTYPPAPEAPPVWEPTKADAAPSNGSGDNGYPPLPPPLPPVYGSGTASPTLPPPPGVSTSDNGTAGAPPANGRGPAEAPSAKDGGWIGSLSDAIEQADATGDAGSTSPGTSPRSDGGTSLGGASGTLAPGSFIGGGAVPPPPPAPPAPVGAWASPTSLFENGLPERLAPPPPPPPPPIATALQSMADPAAVVSPTLLGGPATLTEAVAPATETATLTATGAADAETASTAVDNAEDIERQLFNLSPRAREAVKQSSGLYDGRGRR